MPMKHCQAWCRTEGRLPGTVTTSHTCFISLLQLSTYSTSQKSSWFYISEVSKTFPSHSKLVNLIHLQNKIKKCYFRNRNFKWKTYSHLVKQSTAYAERVLDTRAAQTSTVTAEIVMKMCVTTSGQFFDEDTLIFYWSLNKNHTERAEAVHYKHIYNKLRHNNIGTQQRGRLAHFIIVQNTTSIDVCSICAK